MHMMHFSGTTILVLSMRGIWDMLVWATANHSILFPHLFTRGPIVTLEKKPLADVEAGAVDLLAHNTAHAPSRNGARASDRLAVDTGAGEGGDGGTSRIAILQQRSLANGGARIDPQGGGVRGGGTSACEPTGADALAGVELVESRGDGGGGGHGGGAAHIRGVREAAAAAASYSSSVAVVAASTGMAVASTGLAAAATGGRKVGWLAHWLLRGKAERVEIAEELRYELVLLTAQGIAYCISDKWVHAVQERRSTKFARTQDETTACGPPTLPIRDEDGAAPSPSSSADSPPLPGSARQQQQGHSRQPHQSQQTHPTQRTQQTQQSLRRGSLRERARHSFSQRARAASYSVTGISTTGGQKPNLSIPGVDDQCLDFFDYQTEIFAQVRAGMDGEVPPPWRHTCMWQRSRGGCVLGRANLRPRFPAITHGTCLRCARTGAHKAPPLDTSVHRCATPSDCSRTSTPIPSQRLES